MSSDRQYQCLLIARETFPPSDKERQYPGGKPDENGFVTYDGPMTDLQKRRVELAMQIYDYYDFIVGDFG